MRDRNLKGRVHAKTGTLNDTRARGLAGYIDGKGRHPGYVFAILLKRPTGIGRTLMDESAGFREYLEIAEDLNLRLMDAVAEAGTGFAFPSTTAYLAKDDGLDGEKAQRAAEQGAALRASDA